jgi:hypothetical protein
MKARDFRAWCSVDLPTSKARQDSASKGSLSTGRQRFAATSAANCGATCSLNVVQETGFKGPMAFMALDSDMNREILEGSTSLGTCSCAPPFPVITVTFISELRGLSDKMIGEFLILTVLSIE